MVDPIDTEAPDDSGSVTLSRYEYQVHAALQFVLLMLAGGPIHSVTCEHIEDSVVELEDSSPPDTLGRSERLWDFLQIKTRDSPEPWTLTSVLASKALKSLWRTHQAIRNTGMRYKLTAALEGLLDPADTQVVKLSHHKGAEDGSCLTRVTKSLGGDLDTVSTFLELVSIRVMPRRDDIEAKNIAFLGDLAPGLAIRDAKSIYRELARRTRLAMQGKLGPRWPHLATESSPTEKVLQKRLTIHRLQDLHQRITRPDHILVREINEALRVEETALHRKMRTGAASQGNIESAQLLRANADSHQFEQVALGLWPAADVERDLDLRLLVAARSTVARLQTADRPADAIFDGLLDNLVRHAAMYDRYPLFGADGMLLLGRACALSDECRFDWGNTDAQ